MSPIAQYPMFLGMGDREILKVPNSKLGALSQEVMLKRVQKMHPSWVGKERQVECLSGKVSHSNLGPIM